jgi:pimeloyl-ACP methyl ester carboxylesterase
MTVTDWYNSGTFSKVLDLNVFFKREGTGQSLVCIHGFPSSSWDYEAVWPALSNRYDVICSDLIGLGKSDKSVKPLSVSLQADIQEELLIQQGIRQAHMLAHDLGNTVAQELIARQQEGTSKIKWLSCSFLNGGLFPEAHKPLFIQKILISPLGSLVVNLMSESSFRKNMVKVFSNAHPPSEEFITETWKLIITDNGRQMIPHLIRYMQERIDYRDRWVAPLVENTIPHQLIDGVEDPISGEQLVQRYEELIPDALVVRIENSGHYPHLETPEEVVHALVSFVSKH